jgi:hypothetical protein
MLNLLFISDSSKVARIKNVLQPQLKVIIDIVPDFDHGLKDVFEKRPATVCIQDHIAGVTGESVARHIQMLLGASSPTFILIHEDSSKAKLIKGLFEYIVNLNQSEAKLAEEFQQILKIAVGDQWDKIFIPPAQTPASIKLATTLSQESQENADKLVDDFLADLETTGFSAVDDVPLPHLESAAEKSEPMHAKNTADELAEMLLEQSTKAHQDSIATVKQQPEAIAENKKISKPQPLDKSKDESVASSTVSSTQAKPVSSKSVAPKPQKDIGPASPKTADLSVPESKIPAAVNTVAASAGPIPKTAPSEFIINHETSSFDEPIPSDLLQAFEENYRSESDAMKTKLVAVIVLLIVVCAGGWYYFTQKRDVQTKSKQPAPQIAKQIQEPVASPPSLPAAKPATVEQKPVQTVVPVPSAPVAPKLPSFIPLDGHDKSFAASKPGWERYLGKQFEFRVFRAGDKTKAVQVLAPKGNGIPDSLVKSVLTELAGSSDYQISSKENKAGFLVHRGTIPQKADVLLYKKGKTVKAFVVSIY